MPKSNKLQAKNVNKMTLEQMEAEIKRLRELKKATKEAAKPKLPRTKNGLAMKVSEKGAISIYGMGKFPVTLYPNQWERIFEAKKEISNFSKTNEKETAKRQKANKLALEAAPKKGGKKAVTQAQA